MAQDDYYYEIQLTNKQLVFYFMAGATGLILSFLAGIMVGRGVDGAAGEVQASRSPAEERLVEETPQPIAPADDLTYAKRLEGDRVEDSLERPRPSAPPATVASSPSRTAPTTRPTTTPVAARVAPTARPVAAAPSGGAGSFTIQVGAFKDGASAESVVGRLKQRGFEAYVVAPAAADGLFNVRVGSYRARADAERVQARLRDEEKFKPFIVTR